MTSFKFSLSFDLYKSLYVTICVIRLRPFKMYKLLAFALVAAVSCNDLIQGPPGGRQIYNETQEASPAIWKQKNEITIKANDTEVISRVVITDLRQDKDGEAKIVNGGPGHNNVTVELKSPTILRGFSFHIEVYTAEDNEQPIKTYPDEPVDPKEVTTEHKPVMENDTTVNPDTKKGEANVTLQESDKLVTERTTTTEIKDKVQDKVEAPIMTDRKLRNAEETTVVPTAQYANEKNTETGQVFTTESTPLKPNSLILSTYPKLQDNEAKSKVTTVKAETHDASYNVNHPRLGIMDKEINNNGLRTNVNESSQEKKAVPETTESVASLKADSKAYRDISEELGQHVVFGIKRV